MLDQFDFMKSGDWQLLNKRMTTVFVEESLPLPGSALNMSLFSVFNEFLDRIFEDMINLCLKQILFMLLRSIIFSLGVLFNRTGSLQ